MNSHNVELPKEVIIAILVCINNYEHRIEYLEKENRISDYKLNRIKSTTLYDLKKGKEILLNV